MRRTKIVCTLGPSTDSEDTVRALMLSGMNIARINVSHGTLADHRMRIDMVKKVRKELNFPVGLLLDTKGPEIRTGKFEPPNVFLKTGQTFILTTRNISGNDKICTITLKSIVNDISEGTRILIDDGLIELRADRLEKENVVCTVISGGNLSSCKGVNIPDIKTSLPFISLKDAVDLKFAAEQSFDYVAASFTRSKKDIVMLRSELEKNNCSKVRIIAKIENSEGLKNVDDIIKVSDGIMIGRGDLGVEIPIEDVPIIQKRIVKKATQAGKQVIIATQMLESMIKNPRPTRAECTDVANAIYDGTGAIMLSGETASGSHPVDALRVMHKIAERTEREIDYKTRFKNTEIVQKLDITSAISHAICTTAHDLAASAIIAFTKAGRTARMVSRFRPDCMIIGATSDKTVLRQMSLFWGVVPMLIDKDVSDENLFDHIVHASLAQNLLSKGSLVVVAASISGGGTDDFTNLIKVHSAQ
ncbi:MAG: pyruvate kinase [Oscillospiraceae bacterium]|jgi:pyruvate kinase|nr:pyruvate kinase [Oscillospiraceae bacterium]